MLRNAVILGGLGQAGTLLARSLRESRIAVTLIDSRASNTLPLENYAFLQCDIAQQPPELISAITTADGVCVCLPERLTLDIAPWLASAISPGSLWIDTLSVKSQIISALREQAGRIEVLSINPMFAPALGWAGNAVAVIELFGGTKSDFVKRLLTGWNARLEILSAEEHDRLTAVTQVATHAAVLAYGATLLSLNPDLGTLLRLSTPPNRLLLTLLYRMASQNPEVYREIQAYHPSAESVRETLQDAAGRINEFTQEGRDADFLRLFSELLKYLRPQNQVLSQWSEQMFNQAIHLSLEPRTAPDKPEASDHTTSGPALAQTESTSRQE